MRITFEEVARYGGPWFSAVGTISSVIVALFLARRRRRGSPRIRLIKIKRVVQGLPIDCVQYRIANTGEATFTVNGFAWGAGCPFARRYLEQPPVHILGDDRVPATVLPGHEAVISIPSDTEKLWLPITTEFGKGPKSLWIRSVRGVVYLADGRRRVVRLPKGSLIDLADVVQLTNLSA